MSGDFNYRELVRHKIGIALRGDGKETAGLESHLIGGNVSDMKDYNRKVGTLEGLNLALQLMDEAFREMYGGAPSTKG